MSTPIRDKLFVHTLNLAELEKTNSKKTQLDQKIQQITSRIAELKDQQELNASNKKKIEADSKSSKLQNLFQFLGIKSKGAASSSDYESLSRKASSTAESLDTLIKEKLQLDEEVLRCEEILRDNTLSRQDARAAMLSICGSTSTNPLPVLILPNRSKTPPTPTPDSIDNNVIGRKDMTHPVMQGVDERGRQFIAIKAIDSGEEGRAEVQIFHECDSESSDWVVSGYGLLREVQTLFVAGALYSEDWDQAGVHSAENLLTNLQTLISTGTVTETYQNSPENTVTHTLTLSE